VLRFINAVAYSFPETEPFPRGLHPSGAPSRSCSSQTSADPAGGGGAPRPPPRRAPHPLCIRNRLCGRAHQVNLPLVISYEKMSSSGHGDKNHELEGNTEVHGASPGFERQMHQPGSCSYSGAEPPASVSP